MVLSKPIYCRSVPYELFASQLPKLETTAGLVTASIAVSMHELHDVDPSQVTAALRHIADDVRGRVHGSEPRALLAHLHDVLFDELKFLGNTEDYYNPMNSYLPTVLVQRRGLPITLTLIYKCIAEQVGLRVHGINAPWHFMAGVEMNGQIMLVDPFHGGQMLHRDEAFERMEHAVGEKLPRDDRLLARATPRQWLARILQNLMNVFYRASRRDDLAAMVELQTLLK